MSNRPQTHMINTDAREFGLHMKQGGWRLGLLVARNVVPAPGRVAPETLLPKVNATEFARRAGTSNDRVLRHLAAWERAANAGLVPHATDLNPGTEVDLDVERLPAWSPIYNAPATPRTRPRAQTPPPGPVTTRPINPPVPATETPQEQPDEDDAQTSRALEAARVRMEQTLEEIRAQDASLAVGNPEEARSAEWQEDVRYAINAIAGHARRLFDAARDPEWANEQGRERAAADLRGIAAQLTMVADIAEDPSKGTVTDEALASLMNT